MNTWIECIVSYLDENCEYQGVVYQQDVVIELDTGQDLRIFDSRLLAKKGMVGKRVKVWVSLSTGDRIDVVAPDSELGIWPKKEVKSIYETNITGRVEVSMPYWYHPITPNTPMEKAHHMVLSVFGTNFIVQTSEKYQVGDILSTQNARLDLVDIELLESSSQNNTDKKGKAFSHN